MAKYKKYDYKQMIMLPISLEDQLSPGTLEFAIHTLVETRMDLSLFDEMEWDPFQVTEEKGED